MAVFEVKNRPFYSEPESIPTELNYIYKKEKCLYKGFHNVFITRDVQILANQFSYIKSFYRKHSGKQLEHFILSFDTTDEEHDISLRTMSIIADSIPYYLLPEYQTAYSVHKPHPDNPHYHIHFIVNSVNMYTGYHFRLNKGNFDSFMYSIADILRTFNIALRGYSYFDENDRFHRGKCDELALYGKTMKKYTYY